MEENMSNVSNEVQEAVAPAQETTDEAAVHSENSGAAPAESAVKSNQKLDADAAAAAARREAEAKAEQERREKEKYIKALSAMARKDGYTSNNLDEYAELLAKSIEEEETAREAEKIASQTDSVELAKELAKAKREREALETRVQTFENKDKEVTRFISAMDEFQKTYPGVQATPEMHEYYNKGYSMVDAYKLVQYDAQKNEQVKKSNESNAAASIGSNISAMIMSFRISSMFLSLLSIFFCSMSRFSGASSFSLQKYNINAKYI